MAWSTAQLTQMRAQRTASLTATCVLTPAVADGDTPVATSYRCSVVRPKGSMDGGGGAPINRRPRFHVTFPWGTTIRTGDRFTWSGKSMEIAEVTDIEVFSLAVHADCVEKG